MAVTHPFVPRQRLPSILAIPSLPSLMAIPALTLALSAGLCGADAPAPAAPPAAPAPVAVGIVTTHDPAMYAFELDSVNFNSTVVFTQGSFDSMKARERGTFAFQLKNNSPQPFLSIQSVRVDSALTDANEQLADPTLAANAYAVRGAFRAARSADQRVMTGTGVIRVPHQAAETLTISGAAVVLYEGKSVPPIDLTPASAWVGKKQDIPGCANGFTLVSLSPLRYRFDTQVFSSGLLKDLQFFDTAGKRLPIFAMQSNAEHDTVLITGNQVLAPDAGISLVVCGDPHLMTIPFTFTRIPLHAAAPSGPTTVNLQGAPASARP